MKTFDIALHYLKDIDFKKYDISIKEGEDEISLNSDEIKKAHERFTLNKYNTKSNDYYRNMCFHAALCDLILKAHGFTSFFDVASEIIEAHKEIINTEYEPYLRTEYPKVMVQEWIKYCEELKLKTELLEGEIRQQLFFVVYDYIIDNN